MQTESIMLTVPMISRVELLEKDLYIYANYDHLKELAEEKGAVMEESKDFYGSRILSSLEEVLKGKSQEEVRRILSMAEMGN